MTAEGKAITAQVLVSLTRLRASLMINGPLDILSNVITQAVHSSEVFMCLVAFNDK